MKHSEFSLTNPEEDQSIRTREAALLRRSQKNLEATPVDLTYFGIGRAVNFALDTYNKPIFFVLPIYPDVLHTEGIFSRFSAYGGLFHDRNKGLSWYSKKVDCILKVNDAVVFEAGPDVNNFNNQFRVTHWMKLSDYEKLYLGCRLPFNRKNYEAFLPKK